jgi:hypothetical protein
MFFARDGYFNMCDQPRLRASKNAGCYWPCSVRKSKMRWQEMEYYSFLRFSLNTYTDQSWGYGNVKNTVEIGNLPLSMRYAEVDVITN